MFHGWRQQLIYSDIFPNVSIQIKYKYRSFEKRQNVWQADQMLLALWSVLRILYTISTALVAWYIPGEHFLSGSWRWYKRKPVPRDNTLSTDDKCLGLGLYTETTSQTCRTSRSWWSAPFINPVERVESSKIGAALCDSEFAAHLNTFMQIFEWVISEWKFRIRIDNL